MGQFIPVRHVMFWLGLMIGLIAGVGGLYVFALWADRGFPKVLTRNKDWH